MVPVMVNTYYPPNQPTPRRCYAFGQAVRRAIESWAGDKRVALMASGGLSHVVIDEEIDQMTIEGLKNKNPEMLFRLPRERLNGGTSEILNWVALAGAMEERELKYLEYVTTYRSPAGTGCGMGFAYWT
jgi:aromatic ring-opening dioxygenase LigB subunit